MLLVLNNIYIVAVFSQEVAQTIFIPFPLKRRISMYTLEYNDVCDALPRNRGTAGYQVGPLRRLLYLRLMMVHD